MTTPQRIGTGIIILQSYAPGSDPDAAHYIDYVAGTWELNPGVTLTDIMGPVGTRALKVPTQVQPQFTMESMSAPIRVERARIHGAKTALAAVAAAGNIRFIDAYEVGGSLLGRAAVAAATEALSAAATVTEGLFEIQLTAPSTAALRQVWPRPVAIADPTDILMTAPDPTDFFVAAPTAMDTASIFFAVEPAVVGGYEVSLETPSVEHVKITATTDFTLGNSFLSVEMDPCVAMDPTVSSERGSPSNLSTTWDVLGADVRVRQVEFARTLPGTPGIA